MKKLKYTKKHISPIWLWGKDLQLKKSDGLIIYYYCYLCEKLKKSLKLPIMSTGRSTTLAYLLSNHNIDKNIGLLKKQSNPA